MRNLSVKKINRLLLADLTVEGYLQGCYSPVACQGSAEIISPYIHGFISAPGTFPSLKSYGEQWLRVDWTPGLRPSEAGRGCQILPIIDAKTALSMGADFIIVTLLIPNEADEEADNIQHIAKYRTESMQVGLPMAVDFQLRPSLDDQPVDKQKIINLCYNLAVELGADAVILPYIQADEENTVLKKIKSRPILVRCPIQNFINDPALLESIGSDSGLYDGVVLTDIGSWTTENLLSLSKLAL